MECRTASAVVAFDFEGASRSRCSIDGERAFTVLVSPEHAPPINPSPWYAFRYEAEGPGEVAVRIVYLGARHRYAPVLTIGRQTRAVDVAVADDGNAVTLALPPGAGTVSAQELVGASHYRGALARWRDRAGGELLTIARSHAGRAVEALRLGNADAPHLVVLLGRQHPPEVTGAIAMESFVDTLGEAFAADPGLGARYQVLVVPQINPDGVAEGNWRANLGGVDLNRDWGTFSQPETRAVAQWLSDLPAGTRPVAMIDFHSTNRNLFYVQGEEANEAGRRFLSEWLEGRENAFSGYSFTIERTNANPGSGTAKNWFNATYGIPAFTYEVADDADRQGTHSAAAALARAFPAALDRLVGDGSR
ncbi:M14 family metallopeptidase [Aurantiacibacter luteus]|uniref:Peptidase M14 domain-containing protein n=1 Tax=Aurantiacibacter luteus TaxID=1581420 RepID=A0A0G9MT40_9SPHN|nr:M14 family metallopeptidase [Aurantiacibacter luteus]KLE33861.1 hypothetical protein AAW00_12375 [Aurantiacibacter luteus]